MGRKLGGAVPLLGEAGFPSNTMWPGQSPTALPSGMLIHPAVCPKETDRKLGAVYPFGGDGSPSNTMWHGLRPTSIRSGILIHPTVWPLCTNVSDGQTGHDRQRSDSIGRMVLQTSPKK